MVQYDCWSSSNPICFQTGNRRREHRRNYLLAETISSGSLPESSTHIHLTSHRLNLMIYITRKSSLLASHWAHCYLIQWHFYYSEEKWILAVSSLFCLLSFKTRWPSHGPSRLPIHALSKLKPGLGRFLSILSPPGFVLLWGLVSLSFLHPSS